MPYIIYKICCDDLPDFNYIGSTKSFRNRKSSHKKDYNKGDTKKIYTTIRENGGWDNWRMVILEDMGAVERTQARIKEQEYRVNLNANMNSINCFRSEEDLKKQQKKYYNKNQEKILEYKKGYYQNNKEQKKHYDKQYYQNNKNKMFECECGRTIKYTGKLEHKNSLFHKKYISNIVVDEDNES
tara:strand:- start:167 stop:718 length:552 start_codon:yes stop_codon:yes gene_type:complete